ncbi:MAG: V-type ATP synthase subunit I [Planctomycetota bacterium]|jgi:V/A-type H+-transporting ATPase subunit I
MAKILIVSHRSEAADLLDAIQKDGICQILNAEKAIVSKQWPDLGTAAERPRQTEELLGRLLKSLAFLKNYAPAPKGLVSVLAPRTVIDQKLYNDAVSDPEFLAIITQAEQTQADIEQLKTEIENLQAVLHHLAPWKGLETPVEELGLLERSVCIVGLLPAQQLVNIEDALAELDAVIELVGTAGNRQACIIVCLKAHLAELQKLLRSADFENVGFEPMTGTVAELIQQHNEKLNQANSRLQVQYEKARSLAEKLLKFEILCDHYANLLARETSKSTSPATEHTVLFEGWVKQRDYARLEQIVQNFAASDVSPIALAEDEQPPVEIDNNKAIRPFEAITRLYGMPTPVSVDPTVFLAPFFALFFGLCLTDAGYGIVLVAVLWYFLKKLQGDKRFVLMLMICSVLTIAAGIITGGWFGDAVQNFLPQADELRRSLMLFDPMRQPMVFFGLSLALGYIQIMFGIIIALFHCISRKDYTSAFCNQLTWLIMLNSLILFGLSKGNIIPSQLSVVFAITSIIPAITILLFSEREGSWPGRIGMGVFKLFCTVFYVGDVLSYVRIMALGMVSAGFGMAINIIVQLVSDIPYIGWLLGALMFVGGHLFNLALSVLGSFVHSMRLQFVEFFPKFFEGGGREFAPLKKEYKYIHFG